MRNFYKPLLPLICAIVVIGTASCGENPKADAPIAAAQTTCPDPEYRQMDFWVGEWDLSWIDAQGQNQEGRNIITQTPYGNCVITENFNGLSGSPLRGMSVSTYSKPHGLWRQTWVDNNGSYFSLYGGPQVDGTFVLTMDRLGGKGPYSRMVFEDIEANSLVWRWQGKQSSDNMWADQWVINYVRR